MTRTGSLAYYLAAWVCGCTFMGIFLWIPEIRGSASKGVAGLFFVTIALSLMCGAASSLAFGCLLRILADWIGWRKAWQWLLSGAILAPVLITVLGVFSSSGMVKGNALRALYFFVFAGPGLIHTSQPWLLLLTAVAGAATAWVLFRVHRAFAPQSCTP